MNGPTEKPHANPKIEPTFSANTVSDSTSLTVQPALMSNGTSYVTTDFLEAKIGQMKAEMTTLRQARESGNIVKFAKEHRRDPKGDADAFNATLEAMAGKSKAVPVASKKRNPDD